MGFSFKKNLIENYTEHLTISGAGKKVGTNDLYLQII